MANKRGHCPVCNRDDVTIVGDQCWRCWDRNRRGVDQLTGKPIEAAPIAEKPAAPLFRGHDQSKQRASITTEKPVAPPPAAPMPKPASKQPEKQEEPESRDMVMVPFTGRDAELLSRISAAAEMNRRTIANEILFRLDRDLAA